MSVALVTVVSGEAYERYAKDMFASAFEFFGPDPVVAHIALPGREGWPDATLYRYHVLLEHADALRGFDYVYMIDADMRFEAPVGEEILSRLVATLHPGYVGKFDKDIPLERDSRSAACPPSGRYKGRIYYCGGFVGGEVENVLWLADHIRVGVDHDERAGVTATWHDESHLNQAFSFVRSPSRVLTPSYCYPDDDSGYQLEQFDRRIVAIDKTAEERGDR